MTYRIGGSVELKCVKKGKEAIQFFEQSGMPVRQPDVRDIGLYSHTRDLSAYTPYLNSQQSTYLVNIISNHSGKVVLLAQPVFLDLHFPATLNDRVSRQLTHI